MFRLNNIGASTTNYSIILALIALAVFGSLSIVSQSTSNIFDDTASEVLQSFDRDEFGVLPPDLNTSSPFPDTPTMEQVTLDELAFTDVDEAEPNQPILSDYVRIVGFEGEKDVTISSDNSSAKVSIYGFPFSDTGKIQPGMTVRMVVTSHADFEQEINVTLKIDGQEFPWKVTTRGPDFNPSGLVFDPVTDAEPATTITSSIAVPDDFDGPLFIAMVNEEGDEVDPVSLLEASNQPRISVKGGTPGLGESVDNGFTVQLSLLTSADFGDNTKIFVKLGEATAEWSVTNRTANANPNQIAFVDVSRAALSSQVSSDEVAIDGFEGTLIATVSGGNMPGLSVNGGAWTDQPQEVKSGDNLVLRQNAGTQHDEIATMTLTVGSMSTDWSVITLTDGPDPFSISAKADTDPDVIVVSDPVVLQSIVEPVFAYIDSDDKSLSLIIDGNDTGSNGALVQPGESIAVRALSSSGYESSDSWPVVVAVPGLENTEQSASFDVTTRAQDTIAEQLQLANAQGLDPSELVTKSASATSFDEFITVSVDNSLAGAPLLSSDNGNTFSNSITIESGSSFKIQATAPSNLDEKVTIPVTVGSSNFNWIVGTDEGVCPANVDAFNHSLGNDLSATVTSNVVTIGRYKDDTGPAISISSTGAINNPVVLLNGQPASNGDVVRTGDTIGFTAVTGSEFADKGSLTVSLGSPDCKIIWNVGNRQENLLNLTFADAKSTSVGAAIESSIATVGPIDAGSVTANISGYIGEWKVKKPADADFGAYTTDDLVLQEGDEIQITSFVGPNGSARSVLISAADPAAYAAGRWTIENTAIATNNNPAPAGAGGGGGGGGGAGGGGAGGGGGENNGDGDAGENCTAPDYLFTSLVDLAPSVRKTSNAVTVQVNQCQPSEFYEVTAANDAVISVNGRTVSSGAIVLPGDQVALTASSPDSFNSTSSVSLNIGAANVEWSLSSAAFTAPNFEDTETPELNTAVYSFEKNIGRLPSDVTITVRPISSGLQVRVGNGSFTSSSVEAGNNQTIQLTTTSPSSFDQTIVHQVEINGEIKTWNVKTSQDMIPDNLIFDRLNDAEPGQMHTSNTVTISGIDVEVPFIVFGDSSTVILNGTDTGKNFVMVKNNDKVALTIKAADGFRDINQASVTIGPFFTTSWITETRAELSVIAVNDNFGFDPNQSEIRIPESRIIANDVGSSLSIFSVSGAQRATVSFDGASREVIIKPGNTSGGTFSFSYRLKGDNTNTAFVTGTIKDVNPCPAHKLDGQRACVYDMVDPADYNTSKTWNYKSGKKIDIKTTFYDFQNQDGIGSVFVEIWGAGGAGGGGSGHCGARAGHGGGGAYISGNLSMFNNEIIKIGVGSGGRSAERGGRLTGIMRGGEWYAVAGSGGAGGARDGVYGTFHGGQGGAGGTLAGQSGSRGSGGNFGRASSGGTQTGGGIGGVGGFGGRDHGALFDSGKYRGDGGDGFYGGGASSWGTPSGGGGGSSLMPDGWSGNGGNRRTPGNSGNISKYTSLNASLGGVGACTSGTRAGGDGLIVIHY